MSINVLASTIVIASTSYVQPTFDLSYLQPVAQVSYVDVAAQASYLDIQVTVELSTPDRIEVEVITPADLISLQPQKNFTESLASFTDVFSKVLNKANADTFSTAEQITAKAITKALADLQIVAETKEISLVKALLDTVTPAELASLDSVKAIADLLNEPVDFLAVELDKELSDSFTIADAISNLLDKFEADSASLVDDISVASGPAASDSTGVTDDITSTFGKGLDNSVSITETLVFQLQRFIVETFADLLFQTDAQILDITSQKADNILTASNGLLIMQDYCDITYFLEDYVGISRTFT